MRNNTNFFFFVEDGDNPAKVYMDSDLMKFKHFNKVYPESVCSKPCSDGETKIRLDSNKCCWSCFNCTDYQYATQEDGCVDCDQGFLPNHNKTACLETPLTCMNYGNSWAVVCIAFAMVGILATMAISIIFWTYWDTPIIKASARELSALLLIGKIIL